jgi:GTP-binding protein
MATPATIDIDKLPTLALVGRVNVGKSTLFNRLVEKNQAIVSDIAGTTRTNNEGVVLWRGKFFHIIDTGGLTFENELEFEKDIIRQVERAVEHADMVIFVTDAQVGILPQERELARKLRQITKKPIMLVANKVDTTRLEPQIHTPEWSKLGLGEPYPVSAVNGRNVGDFLDVVFKTLKKHSKNPKIVKDLKEKDEPIRVSIFGKPNVGKSSLFNKLIGDEKVIVSPIAHTTREPHDTLMTYLYEENGKNKKQKINFIDTAGIRRKAQVHGELERAGISKSLESFTTSDIILFVLDGSEPISHQDMQLGGLMERHSKSVIVILNKWDLCEDNSDNKRNEVKKMLTSHFPHLDFAPILLVSGLTGYRVHQIFPTIVETWKARHTHIEADILGNFIQKIKREHRPSRGKGTRHPDIMGFRQLDTNPPIFEMLIKYGTSIHISYVKYVENRLREEFNFFGTPIVIKLTKMKRK